MGLYGTRFKAPKPTTETSDKGKQVPFDDSEYKRELESMRARAAVAEQNAEKAAKEAREAKAATEVATLDKALTTYAVANKVANLDHVMPLMRLQYELREGKVVYKADAAKAPDVAAKEFFSGEGKAFVGPQVPTGNGAPGGTGVSIGAPDKFDTNTSEGATAYVRNLLSPNRGQQDANANASIQPGQPGAGNPSAGQVSK